MRPGAAALILLSGDLTKRAGFGTLDEMGKMWQLYQAVQNLDPSQRQVFESFTEDPSLLKETLGAVGSMGGVTA